MSAPGPAQNLAAQRTPASAADVEAIKVLNQYVQNDTVGINTKLTQYIAVQSLILFAVEKTDWGRLLTFLGLYTSASWFLSMGRTYQFRKQWATQAKALIDRTTGLEAFDFLGKQKFEWFGIVPTNLVQVGIPALGFIIWFASIFVRK